MTASTVPSAWKLPGFSWSNAPGNKTYKRGTHRIVSPQRTLDAVRRFLPVMGITRIANVTGLDIIGLPVVMVCRPNSRSVSVSQGKGLTLDAARASGVMEAIEGYHAEHIALPLKYASYEEMRYSHCVATIDHLPWAADSIFHSNLLLLWIESRDLITEESVWLPYELVNQNFTLPMPPGMGCFIGSSNGLASGNHWLEALSHAICEVVERDSATLWKLKKPDEQLKTRIDLHSIDNLDCQDVLQAFERADISFGVWDATTEIGIPAFVCLILDRERNPLRPLPGAFCYGCHPLREIALLRALTESAQSRLTLITGSRDDISWSHYETESNQETWEARRDLLAPQGSRDFRDVPTFNGETLLDDVRWEIERLTAAGFEQILAVDLTKPEFNLPVARVVIPGLEALFSIAGYCPGKRARARMT